MRRCRYRAIDEPNQSRIGTDVHQATEDGQVGLPCGIDRADEADRLKPGEAIDEVCAVKALPALQGCG